MKFPKSMHAEGWADHIDTNAAPKPDCGRDNDWHQIAVMGVLAAGLTFVGWRIVKGLRRPPGPQHPVSAGVSDHGPLDP